MELKQIGLGSNIPIQERRFTLVGALSSNPISFTFELDNSYSSTLHLLHVQGCFLLACLKITWVPPLLNNAHCWLSMMLMKMERTSTLSLHNIVAHPKWQTLQIPLMKRTPVAHHNNNTYARYIILYFSTFFLKKKLLNEVEALLHKFWSIVRCMCHVGLEEIMWIEHSNYGTCWYRIEHHMQHESPPQL